VGVFSPHMCGGTPPGGFSPRGCILLFPRSSILSRRVYPPGDVWMTPTFSRGDFPRARPIFSGERGGSPPGGSPPSFFVEKTPFSPPIPPCKKRPRRFLEVFSGCLGHITPPPVREPL